MEPIRVMLADDHQLVRKGLANLICECENLQVVAEARDGLEAIEQARKTVPDVILMDVHMPLCSGPQAVRIIKRELPQIKIVMLSVSDEDADVFEAVKSGAQGYLLKDIRPDDLFDAIERAHRGEVALSTQMMGRILSEFQNPGPAGSSRPQLTLREMEILRYVAEGASNREISQALYITEHTVKVHLRTILDKLHLQNRVQAAVYAVRHGLSSQP